MELIKFNKAELWRPETKSLMVFNCQNKPLLNAALSTGLQKCVDISGLSIKANPSDIIAVLVTKYTHEPIEIYQKVFRRIALGETEIFGNSISMQTINKLFEEETTAQALEAENNHANNKGYGSEEMGERSQATFSDALRKNFDKLHNAKWTRENKESGTTKTSYKK